METFIPFQPVEIRQIFFFFFFFFFLSLSLQGRLVMHAGSWFLAVPHSRVRFLGEKIIDTSSRNVACVGEI